MPIITVTDTPKEAAMRARILTLEARVRELEAFLAAVQGELVEPGHVTRTEIRTDLDTLGGA